MRKSRKTYVICYDVRDNRRRSKLARYLEGRGVRVQFSVFELLVDRGELDEVLAEVTASPLFEPEEDSLRCYALCGSCVDETKVFGTSIELQVAGESIVV